MPLLGVGQFAPTQVFEFTEPLAVGMVLVLGVEVLGTTVEGGVTIFVLVELFTLLGLPALLVLPAPDNELDVDVTAAKLKLVISNDDNIQNLIRIFISTSVSMQKT